MVRPVQDPPAFPTAEPLEMQALALETLAAHVPASWRADILSGKNSDWGHIRPSEAVRAMIAFHRAQLTASRDALARIIDPSAFEAGPVSRDQHGIHNIRVLEMQAAYRKADAVLAHLHRDDQLREDAERWRAFISSDRFYVMGWAGFTNDPEKPEVRPDHDPADWLHFTLNVWDKHPAGADRQGRHGRALLLAYVEHRRAELARKDGAE